MSIRFIISIPEKDYQSHFRLGGGLEFLPQ